MEKHHVVKYWNKRFLSMKIQKKLFLCFVLITLCVSLGIEGVILYFSYRTLVRNTTNYAGEYLEQYSENLEYKTKLVLDDTFKLMSDKELISLLEEGDPEKEDASVELKRKRIREIGRTYINSRNGIDAFYILDQDENLYWCSRYSREPGNQSFRVEEAQELAMDARDRIDGKRGEKVWFQGMDSSQIILGRTIFNPEYVKKRLGTIIFVLDTSFFNLPNGSYVMRENINMALYHRQSNVIFASETMYDTVNGLLNDGKDSRGIKVGKSRNQEGRFVTLTSRKQGKEWDIFYFIPESNLMQDFRQLTMWIIGAGIATVAVSLGISYYLAGNMTKNLNHLEKNMRKVEEGDFHVRITPNSYDEIGILCMRFNYMANKIEELVKSAYEDGIAKQQLQMQVLKAQVNPHFLYNTLGSIKCLAKMRGAGDIAEMTTALIELLRASLSKKSEYQTVREEIQYVNNYFLLQRYRYGDSFQVVYRLDEQLDECVILNFLLQPLIENALFYGIDLVECNGIIGIETKREGEKLILTVEDNGCGMSEEKMEAILKYDEKKYDGLTSIGVCNVNQRIKRYFGQEYGLRYKKRDGGGTVAEVVLPLAYSMEEVQNV